MGRQFKTKIISTHNWKSHFCACFVIFISCENNSEKYQVSWLQLLRHGTGWKHLQTTSFYWCKVVLHTYLFLCLHLWWLILIFQDSYSYFILHTNISFTLISTLPAQAQQDESICRQLFLLLQSCFACLYLSLMIYLYLLKFILIFHFAHLFIFHDFSAHGTAAGWKHCQTTSFLLSCKVVLTWYTTFHKVYNQSRVFWMMLFVALLMLSVYTDL